MFNLDLSNVRWSGPGNSAVSDIVPVRHLLAGGFIAEENKANTINHNTLSGESSFHSSDIKIFKEAAFDRLITKNDRARTAPPTCPGRDDVTLGDGALHAPAGEKPVKRSKNGKFVIGRCLNGSLSLTCRLVGHFALPAPLCLEFLRRRCLHVS